MPWVKIIPNPAKSIQKQKQKQNSLKYVKTAIEAIIIPEDKCMYVCVWETEREGERVLCWNVCRNKLFSYENIEIRGFANYKAGENESRNSLETEMEN